MITIKYEISTQYLPFSLDQHCSLAVRDRDGDMYVLEFIFATIFIFCCYESLKKFINKKIAVVIEETDIIDVEYPSVRFVEH